jgi:hypothetical protein
MENDKSEVLQLLDEWEAKGFTCRFIPKDGMLLCIETGKVLDPAAMSIISVQRYEGTKDLDDQTVVFVITDGGDTNGVIMDSYGAHADAELTECVLKLKMENQSTYTPERPLIQEIR